MPDTANQLARAVAYNFPSASDQLSAALSAPIPFFFALVAVGFVMWTAIWGLYKWRYDRLIDITKGMLELANVQTVALKNQVAEHVSTNNSLQEDIRKLLTEKTANERELQLLSEKVKTLQTQSARLRESNNAITDSLSRIPSTFRTWAPSVTVGRSASTEPFDIVIPDRSTTSKSE